jgi:alpha-beta hydrolase superfamily lysophospholipase
LALLAAGILLAATGGGARAADKDPAMKRCVEQLRADLPDLAWTGTPVFSESTRQYLRFYHLDVPGCTHRFGAIDAGKYRIAMHVFEPPAAKRAVLIVHGYLDHAGVWSKLIPRLVEAGFLVAVYDQPGHGLSDGARADIGAFSDYVAVLETVFRQCVSQRPMAWDLAAHSMGGAIVADYILTRTKTAPAPARVVLLAPLLHSAAWKTVGVGRALVGKFIRSVPRKYQKNSSDTAFLAFVMRDPLQVERLPLHWLAALRDWNRQFDKLPPGRMPVTIVQGDADSTVDWKYNLKIFRKKFPAARVIILPGARHQLMNENEVVRTAVLKAILPESSDPG